MGRYVSSKTQLRLDKSCDQRLHKPDGTRSIETQLMADYGVMQVRVIGGDGEADQEIKFLNALPTQWAFGSGVCQLEQKQTSALCRCLADGVNQVIPNS